MVKTYDLLNHRLPILSLVMDHLTCSDIEKDLLRDLFVVVYNVGFGDAKVKQ